MLKYRISAKFPIFPFPIPMFSGMTELYCITGIMEKYCKKEQSKAKNEYSIIIKIKALEIPTFCVIVITSTLLVERQCFGSVQCI